MDTKKYKVDFVIELDSVWHIDPPEILLIFSNNQIYHGPIIGPVTFRINSDYPAGHSDLLIEFYNKKNNDTDLSRGLDKAVIIKKIMFNNISSQKFIWAGTYFPRYNPQWKLEQEKELSTELKNCDYLGWNGVWKLDFEVPVFTWVHAINQLGYIYK